MSPSFTLKALLCAVLAASLFPLLAIAQTSQAAAVPSRITQAVNEANVVTLRGNTHPLAQARFDQGAAADAMPMQRMLLVLKRSGAQETALDSLLDQQQNPTSPNYHHWLTPQQFGQQFGPSDQDIQTVTNWLQSHGFTIAGVSNGRTVIEFSGTAGQVRQAFHTEIHRYAANGQSHWANSSDPQIPDALSPVVAGINTLYNFPRQSMHELVGVFNRSRATGSVTAALGGNLTFPNPCNPTSAPNCNFAVGPADFAKIYNVPNAALVPPPPTAYNGDNQTIVVVGESDVNTNDIAAFRKLFGLPTANFNAIVSGPDPGFDPGGAETEADLDIEWAGAVAPNASIDYVISQPTEASLGVDLAAQYAVDNNLGSVLSESYGICEFFMGTADNVFYNNLWQQAAAQGITVTVSSGDGGASVCDQNAGTVGGAQFGLSVSGFASTPYNIAVGGTDFNDLDLFTQFWNVNPTDTPTVPSALGYIPEMTWNDSCTNYELFPFFDVTTAEQSCNSTSEKNDGLVSVEGGSGGESSCTVSDSENQSTCSGGYPKPSWQTGNGVPNDGKRDVPDVSLFASNGFNGSFYIVCEEDLILQTGTVSCDPYSPLTSFIGVGGTSASTPAFAGIMALVNQATSSRQGNANYILYKLAAQSGATCASAANPPSSCVFHDIPSGSTIQMPCASLTHNCTTTVTGDLTGVLTGYPTTSGYDLATGLGSVNATNLISNWMSFAASLNPSTTSLTLNGGTTAVSITHGQSVSVSVNVAAAQGTRTPTGSVSLIANTGANGAQSVANSALPAGSQSTIFNTNALPGGASYTVDARYPGDGTFAPSTSNPITVTVSPESSSTKLSAITYSPTTGQIINSDASSVQYGSNYLLRADITNSSGADCVTESTGLQAYECPTGTVNILSDGSTLLPPALSLNSQAYAESNSVQITGGSHSLTANYSGDNSYTASSTGLPLTVTPATTTTHILSPVSSQTIVIGSSLGVSGQVSANSLGVFPTGTFALFDGTQQLTGTSTSSTAFKSTPQVFLNGAVATTLPGPSGPHVLTLQYSGDANYASSVSSPVTVNAVYPVTMSLAATPNSIVYGANSTVTLTATLTTTNPSSNAALKPTGAISFRASIDQISGSVSTIIGPDQNGNWSIQATVTVSPQQSEFFYATYVGDQNYASSTNLIGTYVTVVIPDFSFTGPSQNLAITAGQTGSTTLTITPLTSYTSTVTLSCTPSFNPNISVPGATCTFSPPTVTLSNSAPATVTLSLATLAPSTTMNAMSAPRVRHLTSPFGLKPKSNNWISFGGLAVLLSVPMFFLRRPARFPRAAYLLAMIGIFCFIIGCGGGAGVNTNGSGGNGNGGNGGSGTSSPEPTTTTLSTTSTKFALGSSATLTGKVSASTGLTGVLSFNDASFPFVIGSSLNLGSGTAQVQMLAQSSIFAGTHVVTAQYEGDQHNNPSQSGPLNIVVTGATTLEIAAQTSTDTHILNIPVTIQ